MLMTLQPTRSLKAMFMASSMSALPRMKPPPCSSNKTGASSVFSNPYHSVLTLPDAVAMKISLRDALRLVDIAITARNLSQARNYFPTIEVGVKGLRTEDVPE